MQRKYNLTQVDCSKDPAGNDPNAFYSRGRDDFKRRISHVLTYQSRHTGAALGQWHQALFSVEPENEPFGHSAIAKGNEDWMCDMSTLIRSLLHPAIAVRFWPLYHVHFINLSHHFSISSLSHCSCNNSECRVGTSLLGTFSLSPYGNCT